MEEANEDRTARIRALNDLLRCKGHGGSVLVTAGIAALGEDKVRDILQAVATFDAFTGDNDPHGEHDCAIFEVEGERLMFKIDYYDATMTCGSPDPANPNVTTRVLTLMLPSDY